MSTFDSTTLDTRDLSVSFAGIIRSHMAVHVAGELADTVDPVCEVEPVVETVVMAETDIVEGACEEQSTPEEQPELSVGEMTVPKGPVRPILVAVAEVVEEVVEEVVSEAEVAEEVEVEAEVVEEVVEEVEDEVEEDFALDFDVSAYLTSGAQDSAAMRVMDTVEQVQTEDATEGEPVVEPVVETEEVVSEPVVESFEAVEDDEFDPDLEGFNPMKYLSGGGGASQPVKKVEETPVEPHGAVVAARQADPMSLLRELSSLTR